MTNRDLTEAEKAIVETLIDSAGLQAFLEGLSTICGDKSVHIATHWQDASLAKRWATLEGAFGVLSTEVKGL